LLIAAAVVVVVVVAVAVLSTVSLSSGGAALANVEARPLAGTVTSVRAWRAGGRAVPVIYTNGEVTPLRKLRPGEAVTVSVAVKRPGWLSWALGSEETKTVTLHTPVARVAQEVLTVPHGSSVSVNFDAPVVAVAVGAGGELRAHRLAAPSSDVSIGSRAPTGTVEVAAAARSWETVGRPARVSWFPPARQPVLATLPAAGANTSPAGPIYLTFSQPVTTVLGGSDPTLSPATPGTWREANSHMLVFTPSGFGAPMDSELTVHFPRALAVSTGSGLQVTRAVHWHVPAGSTLRLQQLLAQAGYLPLEWHPSGADVAHTASAELQAAVEPPRGSFSWRYPNTPHQLEALWSEGQANEITRGAVMRFEDQHELEPDGEPGAAVWKQLLQDAIAGRRTSEPYSYVYVHREVPETTTLWSAGHVVITTPANSGVPGAETELGTFPVFEHIPEGTMTGTDPDGVHYEVHGIKWISYFNGGDALHYYERASYGFPQSNGCIEMPLAAAAKIWPYTPIGTLVTVET
jgi:peptidoglycan hydrolase-like protein with peptidoglycan-binding domain